MNTIEINGTTLCYEFTEGPGDAVVFLNGVMASFSSWRGFAPAFLRAGYTVLLHDFRGQLLSGKPPGPYRFATHAEDLRALLAHLGIEKPHLVGTSYGGEVAMRFCADYPDAAASLTVIDSVSETDAILAGMVDGWISLLDAGDARGLYRAVIPVLYSDRFIRANAELLRGREEAFAKSPADYFTGQRILYRTFLDDLPFTEDLGRIKAPALVLCGTEDILKPPKFSRIIADRIPGAEYLLIPDAGHVAIFEKPGEVISAVLGFIEKNRG